MDNTEFAKGDFVVSRTNANVRYKSKPTLTDLLKAGYAISILYNAYPLLID